MNLFLYGAVMTVGGPALIAYGRRRGETDEENSRILSVGYALAICGPLLLLSYLITLPKALLVALAVSGLLLGTDRISIRRRGIRLTTGAARYGSDSFLVVAFICALRFFVVEPFVIPSSSMRPTLAVGDFIIADKFSYGLRIPVLNKVILPVGSPKKGDVLIFEFPNDRNKVFVKRVVGTPGDVVDLDGKSLSINGQPIKVGEQSSYAYTNEEGDGVAAQRFKEVLGGIHHDVLLQQGKPWVDEMAVESMHPTNGCGISKSSMRCVVPQGHYFVLGDNRDNSLDSRYWGFVPDSHILGRADVVVVNPKDLSRAGVSLR
ncbi:signal peptidase I [Ralstonia pseudosolanacearum]|uniref:signal peptidase I n=1 Tax=Ralstonia pseudosolanacearum TaxID=1310165 RepID=UPI003CE69506